MDAQTLDKLQKIIALMDNAGTTGEAEAAAMAMNRLLIKHNVSEAEVRARQGKEAAPEIIVRRHNVGKARTFGLTWKLTLLNVLCKHNLCQLARIGDAGGNCWLVGSSANVDYVLNMFDHLAAVFTALARQAHNHQPKYGRTNWVKFLNNFMLGAASGLHTKFMEDRKVQIKEDERVNALVDVNDAAVAKTVNDLFGRLSAGARILPSDSNGWSQGYAAGRNYQESKPLTDHAKLALKG